MVSVLRIMVALEKSSFAYVYEILKLHTLTMVLKTILLMIIQPLGLLWPLALCRMAVSPDL